MTVNNVELFIKNPEAVRSYYRDLLAGLGINSNQVNVSVFSSNNDFSLDVVTATTQRLFDIGNPGLANINPASIPDSCRSMYHGTLDITHNVNFTTGGNTTIYNSLGTGPNSNVLYWSFMQRNINPTILDVPINQQNGLVAHWDNVLFRFVSKTINSSLDTQELSEILFNGLRIDY